LCRREGIKLYLKGERCFSDKCAVDKRKTAPGQHGMRRTKLSDYGAQLREKQKLKRLFGLLERQFRSIFERSAGQRGKTGDLLIQNLEMRLDSVVYRLGVGINRNTARQLVRHNHVLVNGHRCNIPARVLKVGDTVSLKDASQSIPVVALALESARRDGHGVPGWLKWEHDKLTGQVVSVPAREDVHIPVKEQSVVELYSK